jgi:hypothetical protein
MDNRENIKQLLEETQNRIAHMDGPESVVVELLRCIRACYLTHREIPMLQHLAPFVLREKEILDKE